MINITESDIAYAEEILLESGKVFDGERRAFIKNFKTIDLQAVPGSGKTTALLAKLLILEKKLPLVGNGGILVISHTNAAVNEIRERIGHHCPKLFSHPNFVGTIQSFVDTFLAIPAYLLKYKQKPVRIDNEIYNETVSKFFNYGKTGFLGQEKSNAIYYNKNFNVLHSYRFQHSKNGILLIDKINGKELIVKTPNAKKVKFTPSEISRIEQWLRITKEDTLRTGTLCFDDAYFLADLLLAEISNYDKLLQKRFQYVFVDEMQDMEVHQMNLIERLFTGHSCDTKLQRLGDINQSIFSSNVNVKMIWNQRQEKLFFKGSHRLSKPIAEIVQSASLTQTKVDGLGSDEKGKAIDLKPLLLVFNVANANKVIPTFSNKIKELQKAGLLPLAKQNYHAFGWRKETDKEYKLCLNTYLPTLKNKTGANSLEFKTLEDYLLFFPKKDHSLKTSRGAILNGLVKILRVENVRDEHGRYFTSFRLLYSIKKLNLHNYELLKSKILKWSIELIEFKSNDVLLDMKDFAPVLLNWLSSELKYSQEFINTPSVDKPESIEEEIKNYYDKDGFRVQVGTVHNIKGQTHTASLYLETFWNGKYESERLKDQFFNIPINESLQDLTDAAKEKLIQTAKMVYVGFSRPTHLLAFAVEKSRFEKNLKDIDSNKWLILEI